MTFKRAVAVLLITFTSLVVAAVVFNPKDPGEAKQINKTSLPLPTNPSVEKQKYDLSSLDLSNGRIVYLFGEINEQSGPEAVHDILKLGDSTKPMYILINSPGGSVLSGASIISAMEAAKGPVVTVCVQLCASMAAMIHQYGTSRTMLNRAFLMFHPATGGVEGEVDKSFSRLGTIKRYIGKMEENAASRSHMDYKEYKYRSGIEMWLDSEDALETKFADKIVYVRGSNTDKLFHQVEVPAPSDNKLNRKNVSNDPSLDIIWE
jgi:ATP-dependent Clp protease protease subunit